MFCGLHWLKKNNINHFDLKPANMLLFKNKLILKLSDFGLGRLRSVQLGKDMTNATLKGGTY